MNGQQSAIVNECDIAIKSRVRLARNLRDFPFPGRMSREQGQGVIKEVKDAVFNSNESMAKDFVFVEIKSLSPLEQQMLVEKHLISPDMSGNDRESGAIINKEESISILINEEDHLRIQCIYPGLQINDAWQLCDKIDTFLEQRIDFAFSPSFGYLTSCPTNVGTGIRASVMMHLPGLVMTGYIKNVLDACGKLGVAVRGLYGENTEASGNMFQFSNQVSLGQSEEEIVTSMNNIALQIIEQERKLRNELHRQNPHGFEDRIYRSFGILSNARIISTDESMKLLSDVRLGIDMGIIKSKDKTRETINEIMLLIQPATLQKTVGRPLEPGERDIRRAELIRNKLKKL